MPERVELLGPYTVYLKRVRGKGSYGTVYEATKEGPNEKKYAVKALNIEKSAHEAKNLRKLLRYDHKHIVLMIDVFTTDKIFWAVMELCEYGDLNQYFNLKFDQIDFNCKVEIMKQIADGLSFLHDECDIVHRDIKPGNVLGQKGPGQKDIFKIADFGLAKFLTQTNEMGAMKTNVGTMAFKAPEFFTGNSISYDRSVDIFAMGLTNLTMIKAQKGSKLIPFPEGSTVDSGEETYQPIGDIMYRRKKEDQAELQLLTQLSTDSKEMGNLKGLTRSMISYSPEERPTARDCYHKLKSILSDDIKVCRSMID